MFNLESEKQILSDYDRLISVYSLLTTKVEQLFRDILNAHGIMVHAVSSRVKSRDSVSKKIAKNTTKYERLEDLTDIAGLRITTYFSGDVDRIGGILEREFKVDVDNSVDKRNTLAVDKFGYLSLHHVLSLNTERIALVEYQAFRDLKFEVQTRSILQHAWAEIEHDLGYKSTVQVPKHLTRRFALVAGQLESVDNEFNRIKTELEEHRKSLAEAVNKKSPSIPLTFDSLNALIKESGFVKELDYDLASGIQVRLDPLFKSIIDNYADLIPSFYAKGIQTIDDVINLLAKYRELILLYSKFTGRAFTNNDKVNQIYSRGVSLAYLNTILDQLKKPNDFIDYIKTAGPEGEDRTSFLDKFEAAREDFLASQN
jgi:putative GTP pyrophosphokinase